MLSAATEVNISIVSKVLSGTDALDREDVDLLRKRKDEGGNAAHELALRRMDNPASRRVVASFEEGIGRCW